MNEPDSLKLVREDMISELYIGKVGNRLRELETPSPMDMQRWPWELIQNAKDSIAGTSSKVNITITEKKNEVVFEHDGAPFQAKSFIALLYQFSSGKKNAESTGRFGTGFLTTHSLAKEVTIESDIQDNGKLIGFEVTMYRNGTTDEELIAGAKKMEKEKKFFNYAHNNTRFTYKLTSPVNIKSRELGIQSLLTNLSATIIFNNNIGNVKLISNGNTSMIQTVSFEMKGKVSVVELRGTGKYPERSKFIFRRMIEDSKELSERFKQPRKLRMSGCVIVIGNEIVVDPKRPSLFCSLPLVGSESHVLPFILNSEDFEPTTERQGILLSGDELTEDKTKISNVGINRKILSKSIGNIFEPIVEFCSSQGYQKLYLLANGLKSTPYIKDISPKWYSENFINPCREVLKKYPLVKTDKGLKKITEVSFPIYEYGVSQEYIAQFHRFTSLLFETVPLIEDSKEWSNYIWQGDKSIKIVTIEALVKKFCATSVPDLMNSIGLVEINNFIAFVCKNHNSMLEDYEIIINENQKHIKYEPSTIKMSIGVPEITVTCIEELGVKWKENHLWSKITSIKLPAKDNFDSAMTIIKNEIKNEIHFKHNNVLIVTRYFSQDDEYRKEMFEYTKVFRKPAVYPVNINQTVISSEVYSLCDGILIKLLIDRIKKGFIDANYNQLIKFIHQNFPQSLKEAQIIRNMRGNLCLIDKLSTAVDIPIELIDLIRDRLGYDPGKTLIDKDIDIPLSKQTTIYSLTNDIKFKLDIPFINFDIKGFSIEALRFVPKEDGENGKQRILYEIVKRFKGNNQNVIPIQGCSDFFNLINKYAIEFIEDSIVKCGCLESLSKYLPDPIKFLDTNLRILNKNKAIVPNQNGKFKKLSELFLDDIGFEKLKDILKPYKDVRDVLLHKSIKSISPTNSIGIMEMIDTFNQNLDSSLNCSKLAREMLRLIPNDSEQAEKQKSLIYIFQVVFKTEIDTLEPCKIPIEFWKKSNEIIIKEIIEKMRSFSKLSSISEDEDEAINAINKLNTISPEKIMANQNGAVISNAEDLEQMSEESDIPEEFKDFMKSIGYDIRSKLKHEKILERCGNHSSVDTYSKDIIESVNNKESPEIAKALFHFLPNNEESKVVAFYNSYKLLMKIDDDPVQLSTTNETIWEKATEIITKEINEQLLNDKFFEKTVERTERAEDEIFEQLNAQLDKLDYLPNQKGEYVKKHFLYVQAEDVDEEILNIYAEMDPIGDFRKSFVDKRIQSDKMPMKRHITDVARSIDYLIRMRYKNGFGKGRADVNKEPSREERMRMIKEEETFRIVCKQFALEWMPKHKDYAKYFEYYFDHADNILRKFILTEDEAKQYKENAITNPGAHLLSMKQASNSPELLEIVDKCSFISELDMNHLEYLNQHPEALIEFINSRMNNNYSNPSPSSSSLGQPQDANPYQFEIGYTGEAAVYEALKESNEFTDVKWENMSPDEFSGTKITGPSGNVYYVSESSQSFDITAKKGGKQCFIEVKSTENSSDVNIHLSRNQVGLLCNDISSKTKMLALVVTPLTRPLILLFESTPIRKE